jgi:hypothetical protein
MSAEHEPSPNRWMRPIYAAGRLRGRRLVSSALTVALLLCAGGSAAQAQGAGNGNRSAPQAATTNPHGDLPAGLDCTACHTASGWKPARRPMDFNHDKVTDFPLTGAHRDVACAGCHLDLKYGEPEIAPTQCGSCHADVHEGRILGECVTCHTTTSFHEIAGRDIHLRTGFPLTGAHLQVTCEACHVDARAGEFTALDLRCVSCHERDYRSATPIDHVAAGFSTDCETCHTTVAFTYAVQFDHATASGGYPLLGAHAMIRCASCHDEASQQPIFQPAGPEDCITCHADEHQRAHAGAFPTTCTACHNQDSWEGAEFDHAQVAPQFPLLGAHKDVLCTGCHVEGSYALRFAPADANDCYACHQADYQREHGGGFPTTCADCHNVNSWEGAEFDHVAVAAQFPLLGAHQSLACVTCHVEGTNEPRWPATSSTECYACHADDYQNEHAGSGFPTECTECHDVNSWEGAEMVNHDAQFFPIYSGAHRDRWSSCQTCHITPAVWTDFSCLNCHEHNQTAMDDQHQGRSGYSYDSQACYRCHPNGRGD